MAAVAMAKVDDVELMAAVASGDEQALGELYDRFAPVAFGLAFRVLRQRELAEDAVQEAFLSIWRFGTRFDGSRGSVQNWILTLVHRRAVDLVRRAERQPRQDATRPPEAFAASAADTSELRAERRTVQTALAAIPPKQRALLELAYYSGFTQQEIALRLAMPIGTVKSQTFEGLKRLSQLLDPARLQSA